jgi:hypothetical protein
MCALMQINSVDNWRIELAELCRVTLSDEARKRRNDRWQEKQERQALRGIPEYRLKECGRRWEARHGSGLSITGIADYHMAAPRERVDADGVSEQDDQLIPYEVALRADPTIEAPEERGDASVGIARNELWPVRPPGRTPPAPPFTGGPSGRTSGADDPIPGNNVDHNPDEAEDDQEHLEALQSLPPGVPISDDTFNSNGIHENTLVMSSRYRRPATGGDGPGDSPDQVQEAIDPVSPDSHEERVEVMCPFDRGTVFIEKLTGLPLVLVSSAVKNRWLMSDAAGQHLRRIGPGELVMPE